MVATLFAHIPPEHEMMFRKLLCFVFLAAMCFLARASGELACPFIIISAPKAGTHLQGKVASLLLDRVGVYYLGAVGEDPDEVALEFQSLILDGRFPVGHNFNRHLVQRLLEKGFKILFARRDPRDHLVSMMYLLRSGLWNHLAVSKIKNKNLQLLDMITGCFTGWKCMNYFLRFEESILDVPPERLYISRFEDLVGAAGGGSDDKQLEALFNLAAFLELDPPLTIDKAEAIASRIFGGTSTFRYGKIGSWKEHFTEQHKRAFKKRYNHWLIKLGYEKDDQW